MFGFFFGTLCLIGLVAVAKGGRHRRRWHGCGGGGGGPYRSHVGWEDGDGSRRPFDWLLRSVFRRLDTTPGQETVLRAAADEVRGELVDAKREMKRSRDEIAAAFEGEYFDETKVGESFAKQDQTIENLRKAAVGALSRAHEALDPEQRRRLAELLVNGPRAVAR